MTNFNFVSVLTFVVVAFSGSVSPSELQSQCDVTTDSVLTTQTTFCSNSAPDLTVSSGVR